MKLKVGLLASVALFALAPLGAAQTPIWPGSQGTNAQGFSTWTPYSSTNPMPVAAIGAGSEQTANPVVTTGSAYTAGNCVGGVSAGGSAIQTISLLAPAQGAAVPGNGNFYLDGATLQDAAKQNAQLYAYIFDAAPSGTYTDKAACTLASADQSKVVAVLSWGSYVNDGAAATGTSEAARLTGLMPVHVNLGSGNSLFYTVWWTTGTPTYTARALTAKFTVSY